MNIISFSLWGDLPIYNVGAIENARLRPFIYPNWICRYYINKTVPQKTIDELQKLDSQIIKIEEDYVGWQNAFARFFPAGDKTVSRFISRDCDSRINIREALAVEEWIKSRKLFHLMKDSSSHNYPPILAGMWGTIGGSLPNIKEATKLFIQEHCHTGFNNLYNLDQMFLTEKVWPKIKDLCLIHSKFKFIGNEYKFPIELENSMFVGQVFDENNKPLPESRKNPLI